MKHKKRLIVVSAICVCVFLLTGLFCVSSEFRHIMHLAFPPKDLYKPILVDAFKFHEKGFEKRYVLKPKCLDSYAIGILSEQQNIPWDYKFSGKIKAEFFWKDTFLFEKTVTSQGAAFCADNDKTMKYYKNVYLLEFEVPLQEKYKDDISVRLTVLEPDGSLEKYGDSIKLFIGVSAIP